MLSDLRIEGLTVFSAKEIRERLRLVVGEALPKTPADLARELEEFYISEGYSYATAEATFDGSAGRLTLSVKEGQIDEIEFSGVDEKIARRLAAEFEVRAGEVFNRRKARRALSRALAPTRGAYRESEAGVSFTDSRQLGRGPSPFELVDRQGKRVLVVRLERRTGRVRMVFGTSAREDWFSPVDGAAPALGFGATVFDHAHFNHTYVDAYVAYKFARDEMGYSAGFERPLFAGPRLYVGAALHDMTASDDRWRLSSSEQSLAAVAFKNTFRDYHRRRGYQLHAALRLEPRHEALVSWRDERHEPLANETDFSFFRDDHAYRGNHAAEDGELRAVLLGYAWDSRGFEREALEASYLRHQLDDPYGRGGGTSPGWRFDWTTEIASPELGGDFDYRRHIAHARAYTRMSPHQRLDARILGGVSSGRLPPQRQFALGGIGSVHGYRFKESVGERLILVNLEYRLDVGRPDGAAGIAFFDAGRIGRPLGSSHADWLRGIGVGFEAGDMRVEFGWRLDDIPRSLQVLFRLSPTF